MPVLFGGNIKIGKDYCQRPVRTDARMQMFAWWFESRIAACPDVKTYSLTDKALAIPGVVPVRMEEVLESERTAKKSI